MVSFRRVFIDHSNVCIELGPDNAYYLPNPTPEGRRYDPKKMMKNVIAAKQVDLERWRKMTMFEL
jgi:hypothetical protein